MKRKRLSRRQEPRSPPHEVNCKSMSEAIARKGAVVLRWKRTGTGKEVSFRFGGCRSAARGNLGNSSKGRTDMKERTLELFRNFQAYLRIRKRIAVVNNR